MDREDKSTSLAGIPPAPPSPKPSSSVRTPSSRRGQMSNVASQQSPSPRKHKKLARSMSEPRMLTIPGGFGDLRTNLQEFRKLAAMPGNQDVDGKEDDDRWETLSQLGKEYMQRVEQKRLKYKARNTSLRQTFLAVVLFNVILHVVSVFFFVYYGGLTWENAILFQLYTITTAGFGSVKIPTSDKPFLIYVIIFIYLGLGGLTILAALSYQYISMSALKAKQKKDSPDYPIAMGILKAMKTAFRRSELTRACVVFCYLLSLLLIMSFGLMPIENWSFMEAFYFSSYVMTTVGFGDVAPQSKAGSIYVIFLILFNISFVSIYMGNLGRYYLMVCDANTARIYNKVQEQLADDPSTSGPSTSRHPSDPDHTRLTMKDVIQFVLQNASMEYQQQQQRGNDSNSSNNDKKNITSPSINETLQSFSHLLTLQSSGADSPTIFQSNDSRIPSFGLLVLLQERFAHIIATEIAGCQANIHLKDTTVTLAFDSIEETAIKWLVPSGAQEAFRHAAFEAVLYVGENKLVTLGADALLSLSPFAVLDIFSPLLAAMADAGTMEGWLARTEELASIYFPRQYDVVLNLQNTVT